jgi:hypothetical protein
MENAFAAATIEMDQTGFVDLKDQLLTNKLAKAVVTDPKKDPSGTKPEVNEPKRETAPSKKFVFKKGDQSYELDDDFELEIMADKRLTKMTLRELKDRAAGDVAVKNRMHSLAEEKKKVQATFKEFTDLAKTDPLGALEYISNKAKETDSDFEYNKYIEKLADQAEKLGRMDEKERKSWELEKKLSKAEQDLSQRDREKAVVLRKQEILAEHPEIGDQQFGQMVDAVLNNEELLGDAEDENDVMEKVEELIEETLTQKDIMSVIQDINPAHLDNTDLIFALSDQLRRNPDLDEEDVRDIVRELIQPAPVAPAIISEEERKRDIRTLSNKARQADPVSRQRAQSSDPYDLLKQQLLERKQEISKTPLYKR